MEFFSSIVNFPDDILLKIMSYLTPHEKCKLSLTCQRMLSIYRSVENWRTVTLLFYSNLAKSYLKFTELYGKYFWNITIEVEQASSICQRTLIDTFNILSENCTLKGLKIICVGDKQLLYSGNEITKALQNLLEKNIKSTKVFTYINLELYTLQLNDKLLYTLYNNHINLQFLYIQTNSLLCPFSSNELLLLVKHCCNLKVLSVLLGCLSPSVILVLTENDRMPLKHLSIKCRKSDIMTNVNYSAIFDSDLWLKIINKLPFITVGLHIDESCPSEMIEIALKPIIPYSVIRLETFSSIWKEVITITDYYNKTLQKLILHPSTSSIELDNSLILLSEKCHKLCALHVFTVIQSTTVEVLLNKYPIFSKRETYTLKSIKEIGPWCDEAWLKKW